MCIGCLAAFARLPLVEAVGGQQAAMPPVRGAERRLVATVSPRALIILAPIDGSFAQRGTRPQRTCASSRAPCALTRTIGTCCIGAML